MDDVVLPVETMAKERGCHRRLFLQKLLGATLGERRRLL